MSLSPVTADGVPLGTSVQVSVRTSHISMVIWVIMAVGGGLLFLTIAVRLLRRVRARRSTHGPRLAARQQAHPRAAPRRPTRGCSPPAP